jgi:hypothetical protein
MPRFDMPAKSSATPINDTTNVVSTPIANTDPNSQIGMAAQSIPVQPVQPIASPVTINTASSSQFQNPVLNTLQAQQAIDSARANTIDAETNKEIQEEQISKQEEHWIKAYWRPTMGWLYMLICFMDFVGFPMISVFLPIVMKSFGIVVAYKEWASLTLSNGGLIHLAFGAILGVSAWTRGQEKLIR